MYLMLIITKTLWLLSFLMIIYMGYYAYTSLFAFKKLKGIPEAAPKNRFAAIIAARNEESVIGNLVRSLKDQNYPSELVEVFVIPNNCTDNTAEAASKAGAVVVHCDRAVRSKGDVLNFAFETIFNGREDFDAYCIFDADNLADPDFFKQMNNALCSGMKAAQGFRDSKNPDDTAVSSWYTVYYLTINRLLNHSRSVLNMSSWINGTGFMISDEAIKELGGWNTKTISEDMEITTLCVLHGINVGWVPKAVVFDEQPLTFEQSWKQRRRWSTGMQDCARYLKPLIASAVKDKNINCVEVVFTIIAPYVQLLGALAFALTMLLTGIKIKYDLFPDTFLFVRLFLSFDTSYISTTAVAALAVFMAGKSVKKLSYGILSFWIFLGTWIPINLISLFKKQENWSKIEHTRHLTLQDIIDRE